MRTLHLALIEKDGDYPEGLLLVWGAYLLYRGLGLLRHLSVSHLGTLSIAQATINRQMLSQQTAGHRQGDPAPSRVQSMAVAAQVHCSLGLALPAPEHCKACRAFSSTLATH